MPGKAQGVLAPGARDRLGLVLPRVLGNLRQHVSPVFTATRVSNHPYDPRAVYELTWGEPGAIMETVDARPSGPEVEFYWHTLVREKNRLYQAALVDAPDRWLWEPLLAPETKSFDFDVEEPASVATRAFAYGFRARAI